MKSSQEELLSSIEEGRNTLQTDKLDMSFGEIMSMYEKEEIIINPSFQRLYRWSDYQKARFLESIIIGIPIPPIFVAEDENGRWELVDGLQRLSTILSFFGVLKTMPEKNNWVLCDGDLIKELEGYHCSDLPYKIQLNIKRASCRVEIIKWNSKYDLRFELFNRLNTGGAPLTNQEIRNSLFRETSSVFNDFLKELASNERFISIVDITQQQKNELYLEELVLRFMSLYGEVSVHKSIAQHMTDFMKSAAENSNFDYDTYRKIFTRTVDVLAPLGKQTFKYSNSLLFSTAVYDTTMIGIAENIDLYTEVETSSIKEKINQIKTNDVYRRLTRSGGNNSVDRVKKRIQYSKQLFGKA
ncbi:DUF262 domain-containing protein [Lacrimispora saccharolytica]|uniref:GmrSD restriction endonucleases N-terminal domain-containing protein n=1 Tax=Lacrimispora saccharolytica (strain ATCC 35040 / DSM 2544 / NRCC 2533 / WM1) TaxID=610130 RepID=D9R1M9_LACSW|nr:DUF262 domain-containing protein [Lacrimispora saccharolytica]ADL06552.1 protein of unknown function DUF262 [[Clostridium] saccharolyticum WM1]QRV19369.1 DUF262 domain-containing protein [Lacrimispora saccharolytica]